MAMPSKSSSAIAQVLAGQAHPVMYEPGLQPPEIDPIMLLAGFGPQAFRGAASALAGTARMAPRILANEAGAIFPEGSAIPKGREAVKEFFDILPESQRAYKTDEALHNFHSDMMDWPRVLKDKWSLLKNWGGN